LVIVKFTVFRYDRRNATLSKFDFEVTFAKDGTVESRDIFYKVDDLTSYDITSDTFRSNPEWAKYLHWVEGWRSVLPDMIFRPNKDFKMNVHSFKVYVMETESFLTKLESIKPMYDKPKGTFIDVLPFDYHSNSYFCSMAAAYVATFKGGISEDHLTNNLPDSHSNIVTSIVRFHLHFHLSRFMRNPKLLDQYITKDDIRTIRKFTPVHETWERRTDSSHANLGTWYYDKPVNERRRIRRQKYHQTKYGGTFIEYEYLTGRSPYDVENDYKTLIPKTSRGLTRVGQKLFQQSIEAFVYSVLGAQAKTRWSITGQGAKSLHTQEVFRKVVKDTIVQDDVTVTISNMRTAIANTHVILNFAIMPGLVLIPSDLRILTKPIPGFSNVLTVARNGMTFGKNEKVNHTGIKPVKHLTNSTDLSPNPSHDIIIIIIIIIIVCLIKTSSGSQKTELHDVKCYKVINSKKILYYNAI
jgi:hypothetical protein